MINNLFNCEPVLFFQKPFAFFLVRPRRMGLADAGPENKRLFRVALIQKGGKVAGHIMLIEITAVFKVVDFHIVIFLAGHPALTFRGNNAGTPGFAGKG